MLPWSKRLTLSATDAIPLLDTLHADPARFVTRSVSNHLNDIAKTHPDLVISTLKNWKTQGKQQEEEFHWMSKHSLRTLIKQGNPKALKFLGFRTNPKIEVTDLALKRKRIAKGEAIEFSFTVTSMQKEALMVDYVIDFVKANGTHKPKVHKLKQLELAKGQSSLVAKKHVLHANATTYTLYPGTHHVTLQINGKAFGTASFELT